MRFRLGVSKVECNIDENSVAVTADGVSGDEMLEKLAKVRYNYVTGMHMKASISTHMKTFGAAKVV